MRIILEYRGGVLMALKYSRQRESIKKYLATTKEHPTADMVYNNIRKQYPNISLGTVYRNLNLLVDQGDVIKFTTGDGSDRFDSKTNKHYHFVCNKCSNVSDLFMEHDFIDLINKSAEENFNGEIQGHDILFYGLCKDCQES